MNGCAQKYIKRDSKMRIKDITMFGIYTQQVFMLPHAAQIKNTVYNQDLS